jgi:hypothetical protein
VRIQTIKPHQKWHRQTNWISDSIDANRASGCIGPYGLVSAKHLVCVEKGLTKKGMEKTERTGIVPLATYDRPHHRLPPQNSEPSRSHQPPPFF